MNDGFASVLLRLKEHTGLPSDKDIAELLGMEAKAFHARKARGVFPEEKLLALTARRPDLNLDVAYVLTGQSDRVYFGKVANMTTTTHLSSPKGSVTPALAPDERELLDSYRGATSEVRKAALRVLGGSGAGPVVGRQVFKAEVGQAITGAPGMSISQVNHPKKPPRKGG